MSRVTVSAFELLCFIAWGIGLNFIGERFEHRVAIILVFVLMSRIPYVRALSWVASAAAWIGMLAAHMGASTRLATIALISAALCLANATRFASRDVQRLQPKNSP